MGAVYSGTGNTFVIFDHRTEAELPTAQTIAQTCQKEHVDGFILLETSPQADFSMLYFNRDGSQAGMCGNGMRCLFRFILDTGACEKDTCTIEAGGRIYTAQKRHNLPSIVMGKVVIKERNIFFPEKNTFGHLVDSGVPHLVITVDNINDICIEEEAPYYRHHPMFSPDGVNVNFVEAFTRSSADTTKAIRTFERGVEAETLSCGTGVTATAFTLHTLFQYPFPMQFRVKSQELLSVDATTKGLLLTGDAHFVRLTEGFYAHR